VQGSTSEHFIMREFENNPPGEHELYLKLFITCGGGLLLIS
jgi:hypothetical protein